MRWLRLFMAATAGAQASRRNRVPCQESQFRVFRAAPDRTARTVSNRSLARLCSRVEKAERQTVRQAENPLSAQEFQPRPEVPVAAFTREAFKVTALHMRPLEPVAKAVQHSVVAVVVAADPSAKAAPGAEAVRRLVGMVATAAGSVRVVAAVLAAMMKTAQAVTAATVRAV